MKLKVLAALTIFSLIFASVCIAKPVNALGGQQPVIQPEPVPIDEPTPQTPEEQPSEQIDPVEEIISIEVETLSEIWERVSAELEGATIFTSLRILLRAICSSLILFIRYLPGLITGGIKTIPVIVLSIFHIVRRIPQLISFLIKGIQSLPEIVKSIQQILSLMQGMSSMM